MPHQNLVRLSLDAAFNLNEFIPRKCGFKAASKIGSLGLNAWSTAQGFTEV